MKGILVEDYQNQTLRSLSRSVLTNFLLENKMIPFIVAFDSTTLHFKLWTSIVFNPHTKSAWKEILQRYYETDAYKQLNSVVAGDSLLSKYATIQFLNRLFSKCEEKLNDVKPKVSKDDAQNPILSLIKQLDSQATKSPYDVNKTVNAIVKVLEGEAKEILKDVEVAQSFSHVGIPIVQLIDKHDEFREVARNKIIVNLAKFLHKLRRESPSPKVAKMPTLVGGRPLGVKNLQRYSELYRALPTEYLDEELFSYKVASRTLRVSEQYGSINNYVVYLDKSGSMGGDIKYYASPTQVEYVPKISFATASALALAQALKKVGAKMTLKLFDTEVHDAITEYAQLIDVLLKIKADSGTNISKVLEDAVKYRDEKIIVITDGIDEVNDEPIKNAKSANLDISFIFINTDNELLKKSFPCIHVKEAKPSILFEV